MIAFIALILINILILQKTHEPHEFKEVKEKYRILRKHLEDTNSEKSHMWVRHVPVSGNILMNIEG